MRPKLARLLIGALTLSACALSSQPRPAPSASPAVPAAQVPAWSAEDLEFFLHGSMSTEVFPERMLRAFLRIYPDLFPKEDLSHFGLLPDATFGWPIGFSRRQVGQHLGGLSAVGINCAACHVGDVIPPDGGRAVRVLGMTSHFDAEAFFGAVTIATFRTADPANMERYLSAYLAAGQPAGGDAAQQALAGEWQRQREKLVVAIGADPAGAKDVAPGALHEISGADLRLSPESLQSGMDLTPLVRAQLRLFHNIRAALHIPDQPPDKLPPASGPGRNDAFGLLSAVLFGAPQPYAPVKYGLVWNLDGRRWVHWDGNTRSPIGRNLLASLGLGAPLLGQRGLLDLAMVQRHTDLSETIRAPRYPFAIEVAAASRGAALYHRRCAACHGGPEDDSRLHAVEEIGTEPNRARLFTQLQADRFNKFLGGLQTPGYQPAGGPGIRSTQKYWASSLAGVWARSPYLHNGSVRTMQELLAPASARAASFQRGGRRYDAVQMGYADEGPYRLDTRAPGQSNAGHEFGTDLSAAQKRDLIEYLKTL